MSLSNDFNTFSNGKTWTEKVLSGDALWQQVKKLLEANGATLPATPRRPDLRLICDNISSQTLEFKNPGDHSSKHETIPATGDSTAVMMMIKGDTLADQHRNAQTLVKRYGLATKGFTQELINDMAAGKLSDLIAEAYGPAPFSAQADKLKSVAWPTADGVVQNIDPEFYQAAAFGVGPATQETVFLVDIPMAVHGTGTVAERLESAGIAVAVSTDAQGQDRTRPIAASVARGYYGGYFESIPVAVASPSGEIHTLKMRKPAPVTPARALTRKAK